MKGMRAWHGKAGFGKAWHVKTRLEREGSEMIKNGKGRKDVIIKLSLT